MNSNSSNGSNNVQPRYALIAGSGFHEFGQGGGDAAQVATRFGKPSAPIRTVHIAGRELKTLARHGDDLSVAPHRINYRANLTALKELGTTAVIALNTVGVIRAGLEPGDLAVPDQIVDYTWGRAHTLYDEEQVQHIEFTEPFSERLRRRLLLAAADVGAVCYTGGVYGVTQGPRLETAAEVNRFERDGVDFLGMTAMPEAALARELGLEYACLSLLVNRAAGRGAAPIHADIEASTVKAREAAIKVLERFFAGET